MQALYVKATILTKLCLPSSFLLTIVKLAEVSAEPRILILNPANPTNAPNSVSSELRESGVNDNYKADVSLALS